MLGEHRGDVALIGGAEQVDLIDNFPAPNAAMVTGIEASFRARPTSVFAVASDRSHSRANRPHPALEPSESHTRRVSHAATCGARIAVNRDTARVRPTTS